MPDIKATYVSPTVRLAFLREDHPNATVTYSVLSAEEVGIPPVFLDGVTHFVTCDLTLEPGQPPIRAWKEVRLEEERWTKENGRNVKRMFPVRPTPELLVVLQTKALGRACKLAGYPDDLGDFKSLVLWRTRNREIAAIGAATATPTALALEAAVAVLPGVDHDDGEGVTETPGEALDDETETIEDFTIDGPTTPPTTNDQPSPEEGWSNLMAQYSGPTRSKLATWARDELGIRNVLRMPATEQDRNRVLHKLQEIIDEESGISHADLFLTDEEEAGDAS